MRNDVPGQDCLIEDDGEMVLAVVAEEDDDDEEVEVLPTVLVEGTWLGPVCPSGPDRLTDS